MNFDWHEFLTLAKGLQSQPTLLGSSEASLRSAVSRAYYAAFQCALTFACQEGFEPTYGESSHTYLQRYFSRHTPPNPTYQKISVQLNRLRTLRVKADYLPTLTSSPEFLASSAIGIANIVMDCLERLTKGQDKADKFNQ